jgi:hypothetical protein
LKYAETFDRLGNPVVRRVRFVWLRRIAESAQADDIFLAAALLIIAAMVALFVLR